MTKQYQRINEQLKSLMEDVDYDITNYANASALLFQSLKEINWAGFYFLQGDTLLLGPFQGKTACTKIKAGKGVCGTAVATDQVQPDREPVSGGRRGSTQSVCRDSGTAYEGFGTCIDL